MERRVSESHSDSDSGESWALLDFAPSYTTTESPSRSPVLRAAQSHREGAEKDDDTDGISIISECESEANESGVLVQREECVSAVASRPVERDEDSAADYRHLLGDDTKLKTYVHRRNTRVSSALNVIVLGSVVTAACLAIGHMWGVREECVHQNSSSVNKLLSNLYKLQEENAYLRSKLKELTLAGHGQHQLRRNSTPKQCKKVQEEPLQRADDVGADNCVDPDAQIDRPILKYTKTEPTPPRQHVESDENEKQFRNDLQKLRKMYKENRSWFERQLTERLKNEKDLADGQIQQPLTRGNANAEITEKNIDRNGVFRTESNPLRSKIPAVTRGDKTKESQRASSYKEMYRHELKHKMLDDELSSSEEKRPTKRKRERFINERYKNQDAKRKNDRYENKYEAENGSRHNVKIRDRVDFHDKKYSQDYDMHLNYINKFSHSDRQNAKKQRKESKTNFVIVDRESDDSKKQKNDSAGDSLVGDWSQKRSEMRRRARQELGEVMPRQGARASGRWYLRRMREREQLRARSENNPQRTFYTEAH